MAFAPLAQAAQQANQPTRSPLGPAVLRQRPGEELRLPNDRRPRRPQGQPETGHQGPVPLV